MMRRVEEVLSNIGLPVDETSIKEVKELNELVGWIDEYLIQWYGNIDEFHKNVLIETAKESGYLVLSYPDGKIKYYIAKNDPYTIYMTVGAILRHRLGVKIMTKVKADLSNCKEEEKNTGIGFLMILNMLISNTITDVIDYSLVLAIAPKKLTKIIQKLYNKMRRDLKNYMDEGGVLKGLFTFLEWLIYNVFFAPRDEELSKLLNNTSVKRTREAVDELIRYVVKTGKKMVNIKLDKDNNNYIITVDIGSLCVT